MIQKKKIAAIVGPTGGGKSALALRLAQLFGGQIISCDSMQIYRQMDIGTAKPTAAERDLIKHRMIDIVDPEDNFSCADYVRMAREQVNEVVSDGDVPIFCGGTGLYLDSLLRGSDFSETQVDEMLREELEGFARVNGNEALHARLREIDPESADTIHPNNVKRVIRAIEIYKTGGIKKSELDRLSRLAQSEYDALVIGLRYNRRELLYGRIDERVDQMIREGLVEEVRALEDAGVFLRSTTATQAIGYKEMLGYIRGETTLCEASELLKGATRRYAKRQMTWFASKNYVKWIDVDTESGIKTFEEIVNNAAELFCEHGFCGKII